MAATVPYSNETEKAVLGSVLLGEDKALAQVSDWLKPEHFHKQDHAEVYRAMLALYREGEPITLPALHGKLEKAHGFEKTMSHTDGLLEAVPSPYAIISHAKTVVRLAECRNLIRFAGKAAAKGHESPEDVEATIGQLATELMGIVERTQRGSPHPDDIIYELKGRDKSKTTNVSIRTLNRVTGGFEPTHLWAIGGFSSTGKTGFCLQLMLDLLAQGRKCLYFSLEMARYQLMTRLLANVAGVEMWKIADDNLEDHERGKRAEAEDYLAKRRNSLWIYDDCYDLAEITYLCRKHKIGDGLDVVFVDYLQNLRGGDNEYERLSDAAKLLQLLAKQLDCTIVVLSQISNEQAREGMGTQDAYSFKGTGALRDVADKAIMLVRDRDADMGRDEGQLRVVVRKNRHGPIGEVKLRYHFATGRISE